MVAKLWEFAKTALNCTPLKKTRMFNANKLRYNETVGAGDAIDARSPDRSAAERTVHRANQIRTRSDPSPPARPSLPVKGLGQKGGKKDHTVTTVL